MQLQKFRFFFVILFIGIFSGKMVISIAPAFSSKLDKSMVNSVIMQLEVEQHSDKDGSKGSDKLKETKLFNCINVLKLDVYHNELNPDNRFVEHSKRYVHPFHPSVPTPPPNFS